MNKACLCKHKIKGNDINRTKGVDGCSHHVYDDGNYEEYGDELPRLES